MARLDARSRPLVVDGQARRIAAAVGRRAAALRRAHPAAGRVAWLEGLDLGSTRP
jgi:hypothetical protein